MQRSRFREHPIGSLAKWSVESGGETMGDLFQPTHLMVIGILLLVLFGAKRLPELGKGLGEGLKGFKDGLKGLVAASPQSPLQDHQQVAMNSTPVDPK
jgi:sec-independent protein translocase protein TatA